MAQEKAKRERETIYGQWFTSAWYEALRLDDGSTDPQTVARSAIILTSRERDLVAVNVPHFGLSDAQGAAERTKSDMVDRIAAMLLRNRRDMTGTGDASNQLAVLIASWNNLAWALALKEMAHNGEEDAHDLAVRVADAISYRHQVHKLLISEGWSEQDAQLALDDIQSRLVERLRANIIDQGLKHSPAGD